MKLALLACALLITLPGCALAELPVWAKAPSLATAAHAPQP